ncbi:MAG: transposase zinc-binding domain-containing protein, partial [Gammaproteobacteria bacterium]
MELAPVIDQYLPGFRSRYDPVLLPGQLNAISAMQRCRTPDSGQMLLRCNDCNVQLLHPHSCGHRSCPKCQNHQTSQWLDRQQAKLLPVDYFMATFTVPFELRDLAWRHQSVFYTLLFDAVISTLKDFGLNSKHLGAAMGMTAVLHT